MIPSPVALLRREIELWAGLIFLFAGVALLGTAFHQGSVELRYEREGAPLRATVIGRDFLPADVDETSTTVYRIRYRYSLGSDEVEVAEEVSVDEWEALHDGDEIDLAALPRSEPRIERRGLDRWGGVLALTLMGGVFGSVGAWLGIPRLLRAIRLVRVAYSGTLATGVVLEFVGTGVSINKVPMTRMRYRFHDSKGAPQEGETGLLYPEEARTLPRGAKGSVRYDPSRPDVSVWMGGEKEPS